MTKQITLMGSPYALIGRKVAAGQRAPAFTVMSQDLKEVKSCMFCDKIKVISSFPSLDTPVCDLQVKEFNKHALSFSGDVVVIGISKDLPFAQKRFCGENNIDKGLIFSDYRDSSFGINFGLLIRDLNLLARSVMILDKNDVIRYFQVVGELSKAPDYASALSALEEAVRKPAVKPDEVMPLSCKPCLTTALPMNKPDIDEMVKQYPGWSLADGKRLVKEISFNSFAHVKAVADAVAVIAATENHHPSITMNYKSLRISLTTHAAGGITENDFIMARIIDDMEKGL